MDLDGTRGAIQNFKKASLNTQFRQRCTPTLLNAFMVRRRGGDISTADTVYEFTKLLFILTMIIYDNH